MNPYISDILAQPEALRRATDKFSPHPLDALRQRLANGDFDRLVISGMGSSYNSNYSTALQLARLPIPVTLVNAAELLHYGRAQIGARTLLWLNSQSGHSAEIVNLLERLQPDRPACILATTNDSTSPLASAADICLPIHAGHEATVSTKTYVNMLAVNLLAAIHLINGDFESAHNEIRAAAEAMETYLAMWQDKVAELDALLGEFQRLFILGRGSSMGAVWNGSLINKEAAKRAFEGMHAADFRHGPLELVTKGFCALLFAGPEATRSLNRDLATDIVSYGGRVLWLDSVPDAAFANHLLPATSALTRPLVEILPLQMLTLVMADRQGLQAGHFRHVSKVTARE